MHRTVLEEQRPRLVVVVGEAGAGKSRLVDEFLRGARESVPEAGVHIGRCLAYGDGLTYWPLRELLWAAAGILLQDSAAAAGEKLRRLVERVSAEPERTVSALAVTAGISLPGNPLDAMEPESVAAEVALAWPRLATGLAAHGGAVMVVEDLHWAESALLDMLEQLVARSEGPLLVVVTARPELLEARPGWGGRRAASQLTLEPLTADESRRLVAELLPGASRPRCTSAWWRRPRATRSSPRRSPTTCATAACATSRSPPRSGPCSPRASTRCRRPRSARSRTPRSSAARSGPRAWTRPAPTRPRCGRSRSAGSSPRGRRRRCPARPSCGSATR